MRRAVVCSLLVTSAVAGGGWVFSRGGFRSGAGWQPPPPVTVTGKGSPEAAQGGDTVPAASVRRGHVTAKAPPLPPDYQILLKRSIFAPARAAPRRASPPPEAKLVLRGVVLQEGRFTAFVEDLVAKKLRRLREGDTLGRGRVERVTFDGIDYEAGGATTHVEIGHDLSGTAAPAARTVPTTGPSDAPADATAVASERAEKEKKKVRDPGAEGDDEAPKRKKREQ